MTQTIAPITPSPNNSTFVLHNISWETYEQLLELFAEKSALRMTYYHGMLELGENARMREFRHWVRSNL